MNGLSNAHLRPAQFEMLNHNRGLAPMPRAAAVERPGLFVPMNLDESKTPHSSLARPLPFRVG